MADKKKAVAGAAKSAPKGTAGESVWGGVQEGDRQEPGWDSWSGDYNTPPPGIPLAFWRKSITAGSNDVAALEKSLDEGYSQARGSREGYARDEALSRLERAKTEWAALGKAGQEEYYKAEAEGNPNDPFSREGKDWEKEHDAEDVRQTNADTFAAVDSSQLENAIAAAQTGNKDAVEKLNELLGNIKDPELQDYVGDYVSQAASAAADPRDIEAQQRQLSKFESLSDPRITAEEKLMMELARRQTESDLRGQRGAIANNLQARGVYGSGAEITQNAMAQQEAASRQALEMLGAQANAQKRAMEALGGAADLSSSMRGASAQESQFRGSAADRAAEFNKGFKQRWNEYKAKLEADNNAAKVGRGVTAFKAGLDTNNSAVANQATLVDVGLKKAIGATGQYSGDTNNVLGTLKDTGTGYQYDKDKKELEL